MSVIILSAPAPARADSSERELAAARDMFKEARIAEDAGLWEEALTKLQAVARVKMTPQVRFHLGLCEEHVGRLVEALNHFDSARAEAEARGLRTVLAEATQHAAEVRARAAKLTIVVPVGRDDVRVEVDGEAIASVLLARPLLVDGGKHRIEATAPGLAFAREVEVAERQTLRVVIDLVAEKAPAAVARDRPAPPSAGQSTAASARPQASDFANRTGTGGKASERSVPSRTRQVDHAYPGTGASTSTSTNTSASASAPGWWLIGGGTAALAGALGASVVRWNANGHIDAVCPTHRACPPELADDSRRARSAGAVALGLGVAGGAALGTGLLLLIISPRSAASGAQLSWAPWVGAQSVGTTGAVVW